MTGTAARGYGGAHQALRRELEPVVKSGQAVCTRCDEPILPGQRWDLDHTDDRAGYAGPAHASCNRRAGAEKGNASRRSAGERRSSRDWFGVGG